MAADRLYAGLGLTSLQPVAPLQPWEWRYDWGFLTQWPIGYPLLICAVRYVFGLSSLAASQWINVAACAVALVGWFAWIKCSVPRGVTGVLLSAVGTGCSVSVALLINPSTDVLVVALLPFALLFAMQAVCCTDDGVERAGEVRGESTAHQRFARRGMWWLALSGLTAGGLFWIRYASIFVPFAIGVYLLIEWRRRLLLRHIAVFSACAAGPVVALLLINRVLGTGSTQAQLNLGRTVGFDLSPQLIAQAWWQFTDFDFYNYHWFAHWVYALWPIALVAGAALIRPARRAVSEFVAIPMVRLSVFVTVSLLAMLIAVTALFGDKYDYVGLERYYLPIRPLYFLLFVAPLALVPRRVVRALVCVGLIIACSWLVQVEWPRPYQRWLAANRAVTPYGQWARHFEPGATDLYDWLRTRAGPDPIVVSNFHEYIALETGIPALPIPKDIDTLNDWVDRICTSRGITNPRVLFVLDSENKGREYWIPSPDTVVQTFGLTRANDALPHLSARIMEFPL
jgi:hypothetical protein